MYEFERGRRRGSDKGVREVLKSCNLCCGYWKKRNSCDVHCPVAVGKVRAV